MNKFHAFKHSENGKNVTFNYRTGLCAYGEGLYDGIFRTLGFNGAGYDLRDGMAVECKDTAAINDREERCGFILELDGQSLISHWEFKSAQQSEENGLLKVEILLAHKLRPVEVTVCTATDGSGAFSRWLKIKNLDEKPVPMGRCAILSGLLESTVDWEKKVHDRSHSPYEIGYFGGAEWGLEGLFDWHELPSDGFFFGGRYKRNRYRHPFYVLKNKIKGTCFAVQMAYSGGYVFTFDLRKDLAEGHQGHAHSNAAHLAYTCELDGFKPLRVIDPGETVTTPEVIISMVNGDMDMAIQQMHEFIRSAVMMPPHGPGCYLETCGNAEVAAKRGFDIIYIDAGWYYPRNEVWSQCTGSWDPDPERFPNGITPLVEEAHKNGIKFGLWMEPERLGQKVGKDKGLFEAHNHMLMSSLTDRKGLFGDTGGFYNLANDETAKYIEEQICRMIENNKVDFFRLDYNGYIMSHFSYHMRNGYLESIDLRYYENFQKIYDNVRKKYPNVIFENCASGGGRTDLGCVKYFDHTWVTDYHLAPRNFAITNGMTMCLPPELVDQLVTTMDAPRMADLDFQLFQLMFVRPTSHFPSCNPENPLQIGKFERFMKLYNEFAKPMLPKCRIYHHTPAFADNEPKGMGVLESVSENRDRAMLGVFALADPGCEEYVARFKGLDASKTYRITAVSTDKSFEMSGFELMDTGLTTYVKGALTAELFLAQEI